MRTIKGGNENEFRVGGTAKKTTEQEADRGPHGMEIEKGYCYDGGGAVGEGGGEGVCVMNIKYEQVIII